MNRLLHSLLLLVFALGAAAQNITVTGTVTGAEDGEPLIGASVNVKDGKGASVTDVDGKYIITVDRNATLLFSYIGCNSVGQPVGGRSTTHFRDRWPA